MLLRPASGSVALALAGLILAASHGASAQEASVPPRGGEPAVQRIVAEDDQVRIEELRVRGQTQRITVQSKIGGGRYEILTGDDGRDPSQNRRATGQRVWQLLSF